MAALITMRNDSIVSIRDDGNEYAEMQSLNDAIKLLDAKKMETCREATPIFAKVNNAHNYLCKQLKTLLGDEA